MDLTGSLSSPLLLLWFFWLHLQIAAREKDATSCTNSGEKPRFTGSRKGLAVRRRDCCWSVRVDVSETEILGLFSPVQDPDEDITSIPLLIHCKNKNNTATAALSAHIKEKEVENEQK